MRKMLFAAAVSLIAAAALVGCLKSGSSAGPMDYVPASAAVTGEVDFVKIMAIQKVKEAMIEKEAENPEAVEMKKIGLTPDKITKVAFGLDLTKAADGGEPDGVAIVELSAPVTDEAKAIELLEKNMDGAKVQFLSSTVVAIGTPGMVGQAVKLKGGEGAAVKTNAALMAVADKGSKSGLLWVAALVPEDQLKKLGKAAGEGAPVAPEQLKSAFVSADYSDAAGLSLKVAVTFDAEKTVADLLPKLEQAKGMAAMFSGGQVTAEMIKLEQKGAELVLTVTIPKAVLDSLAEQAKGAAKPEHPEHPAEQ